MRTLEKDYDVAKGNGQKALAMKGPAPPAPPTDGGRALSTQLNEILKCRKLEDLTGGEKERAKDLVRQLGSEWAFALKVFEAKMRKLRQRDDHLRTRISHLLKQADAEKKEDALLRMAQEQLSLTQKRSKRFEALAQLFTGHGRTIRSRHAATHAFPAVFVPHSTRSHTGPPPSSAGCASARSCSTCAAASSRADPASYHPGRRHALTPTPHPHLRPSPSTSPSTSPSFRITSL